MEKISKNVQMSVFLGENIRVPNIFYKLEVPSYLSEHSMNSKLGEYKPYCFMANSKSGK